NCALRLATVSVAALPLTTQVPLRSVARRSAGTYDAPSSITSMASGPITPFGAFSSTVPGRGEASPGGRAAKTAHSVRSAARTRMTAWAFEVPAILSTGTRGAKEKERRVVAAFLPRRHGLVANRGLRSPDPAASSWKAPIHEEEDGG